MVYGLRFMLYGLGFTGGSVPAIGPGQGWQRGHGELAGRRGLELAYGNYLRIRAIGSRRRRALQARRARQTLGTGGGRGGGGGQGGLPGGVGPRASVDLDGRVNDSDKDEAGEEADGARDEEEGKRDDEHVAHVEQRRHGARHLQPRHGVVERVEQQVPAPPTPSPARAPSAYQRLHSPCPTLKTVSVALRPCTALDAGAAGAAGTAGAGYPEQAPEVRKARHHQR